MPAGFSSGFDFSAPAAKVVPRPDAPGGIPDVEVFALRVPGVGLLGVAAAGAFFGLRGLLAAAVLGALQLGGDSVRHASQPVQLPSQKGAQGAVPITQTVVFLLLPSFRLSLLAVRWRYSSRRTDSSRAAGRWGCVDAAAAAAATR